MKVIHQLIAYFSERGALTESQLASLRRQGFWPGDTEEEEDSPTGVDPAMLLN